MGKQFYQIIKSTISFLSDCETNEDWCLVVDVFFMQPNKDFVQTNMQLNLRYSQWQVKYGDP